MMVDSVDVELILHTIDDAIRDWQQNFKTTTNDLVNAIRQLAYDITRALIHLSITTDETEEAKENRLNAEHIVLKLKELRRSMGDIWPENMDSFGRDIFKVDPYTIEAAEFFHPVPFYPDDDLIMKLYRWSVYDVNRTVVYRYYLERSEIMPGQPYYVLGKCYPTGHSQIQPYGATLPDYNQMKIHIIDDLNGQGPPPVASLAIPSSGN